MSAHEFLCQIVGVNPQKFSKEENILLEAELFSRLSIEIEKNFKAKNREYFRLLKFDTQMENEMLENNFIRCLINDILSTDEYTLMGIAYYTQLPEEVINEAALGQITRPSAALLRRIMELHRSVRPTLYRELIKKFTTEFLALE
jgi:hypothetical protein